MTKNKYFLQYFADDDGKGAPGADGGAGDAGKGTPGADGGAGNEGAAGGDIAAMIEAQIKKYEADRKKGEDEAARLRGMNEKEKADKRLKDLEEQLAGFKQKEARAALMAEARKMLTAEGVNLPDEVLSQCVGADAAETKKAVKAMAAVYKTAIEARVKELMKSDPPRGSSGTPGGMTKAEIMKIKDPELRQEKIRENRSLFNF